MGVESGNQGGGFRFEDDRPKKSPKFAFTVAEVSEADAARPAAAAPLGDADPGRWEWRMLAIVLLLLPLVYWLQQWTRSLSGETLSTAPAEVRRSEEVRDPGVAELTILSKLAVKMMFLEEQHGDRQPHQPLAAQPDAGTKKKPRRDSKPAPAPRESDEDDVSVSGLEEMAWTRIDRTRVAIVAGELEGAQAALSRLEALKAEAEPGGDLAAELHWLTIIYEKGPDQVPPEAAQSIQERHGWFGRLALSFGKHMSSELRWSVVSGGERIAITLVSVMTIMVALSMIGFIVGVLLVVKWKRTGYLLRFDPPAPGGSVFLETFGVFLAGFALVLLIQLMLFGMGVEGTTAAACINELLLWSLVATLFWPLVRRMRWRDWCARVGWHKGEGVHKEVVAGLVGYLGSQPVIWIGAWLGGFVERMTDTAEAEASFGYGMFDVPAEGSRLLFVLGLLSAVLWAPVVEETIFRGSLLRHLSGRMSLILSIVISSLLFGLIHPYSPSGLIQVATGGLVYGCMRAWRGSLIAPMTAHAVHNAVVSLMTVSLVGSL